MIFPRKLMTPSIVSGALGTAVISGTRTISRTEPMRTPNVSFPMRKPTTWSSFSIDGSPALRTREFGVLHFPFALRRRLAPRPRSVALPAELRGAIQNEAVHAVQEIAGQLEHLLGCGGELCRTGGGLLHQFAHFVHGANHRLRARRLLLYRRINFLRDFREPAGGLGNLRGTDRLFRGRCPDLLREFVDFGDHVGYFVQRGSEVVPEAQSFFNDARAALHVFDGLARLALDALDQVGDFFRRLRGLFRQLAHFIGDHGESQAMLARTRRFNGRVQRQKVGLLRKIVDDLDDFADVVGAMTEHVDDLRRRLDGMVGAIQTVGGLFHRGNAVYHFLARPIGDVQQDLGSVGDAIDRRNHLIDGRRRLRHAGRLHLRVLHHVLHVDAHLVHGAGHLFDRGRSLYAYYGRF